jgi:ribose-phosphate pyrophosphokinase
VRLFLNQSTEHLRHSLTTHGIRIGGHESFAFADRERAYRLRDDVMGESVAIVGSVLPDPGSLFDLMALHRLVVENGAREIILVVPYLAYARQDRPTRPGEGSLGAMVLDWLQSLEPSRLILFDVHSELIRERFRPLVTELSALSVIANALSGPVPEVIVSPDAGFFKSANDLAALLVPRPEVAMIEKVRPRPNVAIAKHLRGDVRGKHALVVDDMIDTGGTSAEAVRLIAQQNPRSIRLAATHGIFSDQARSRLARLPIRSIWVTNTLPQIRHLKIRVLDIVPMILKELALVGH